MISLLLSLVLLVIVAGVLYWAVMKLSAAFGFPPPIVAVLQVLIVIVVLIVLISMFWPGTAHMGPLIR